MTTPRDYYEILEVSKSASPQDIKKSYRRLARKYHPDLHTGAKKADMEERFKELTQAYDVLRDKDTRAKYDQFGFQWKEAEAYQRARQESQRSGQAGEAYREYSEGKPQDFSAFFEDLFGRQAGQGGPSFRGFAMPGADLEATTVLTLQEVVTGATRRIDLPDSSGQIHTIDVHIPKGIQDGERVRVKGKGAPGQGKAPKGDLYLRIHIKPHPVFKRDQSDLVVTLPVWPWETALGAEVQVPTLSGPVKLKIPAGSVAQQKLRLKGKGLPTRSGTNGDQFVIVTIIVPDTLTDQEKQLFEQLSTLPHPDPRSTILREAANA